MIFGKLAALGKREEFGVGEDQLAALLLTNRTKNDAVVKKCQLSAVLTEVVELDASGGGLGVCAKIDLVVFF